MNKEQNDIETTKSSAAGTGTYSPFKTVGSVGMDRLRQLVMTVKDQGDPAGKVLGLLHLLIGRRISLADGTSVSSGLTWREAASLLKRVRWDKESVRALGIDAATLPPRDREKYWYTAISQARIDSPSAAAAGDQLAKELEALGYVISAAPGAREDPE